MVLTPFTNAARTERVSVEFSVRREAPPEGDVDCEGDNRGTETAEAEEDVSWASVGDPSVLVEGGFVRPDLVPGEYRIAVGARGYQSVTIANTVEPAEDVVLSDITLFHLSRVDAVPFAGQVTLAATEEHDGIRVLLIAEDATVIGEGETDANGEFSIDAAMDETYTIQVIPPVGYDLPGGGEMAFTWEREEGGQFLDPDGARFATELLAQPSSVNGRVILNTFSAAERLAADFCRPSRHRWCRSTRNQLGRENSELQCRQC